ncbi:MAG TPA: prepilin-type N-terminal cleavage/methylation domain-containing protein [Opitutaceae bacterium]|nr:prepilin-type N-terminal cleavage/methylation domain-containing protein [Opitutaceae bacterium]
MTRILQRDGLRRTGRARGGWADGAGECRGRAPAAARRRRGFTLFEVLLVIALVAVAGTMFLVSVESLGRSSPADEFEGAFWRALAQGRERALATRRTVELRWDADTKAFVLSGLAGETTVPVGGETAGKDCAATFSEEVAANDFILVRGALVTRRPARTVRLFPDGTCQPFAVEFELGTYKRRVVIDPWTGAEMLGADEEKGGRS